MVVVLMCSMCAPSLAYAGEDVNAIEEFVDFTTMTNVDLNAYIDQIAERNFIRRADPALQQAWLAAAQIARNLGYACAATMVEHSVNNMNYSETSVYGDGPLLTKIKTTDAYGDYVADMLASGETYYTKSFVITKNDNADLFYALHNVSTNSLGTMPGTSLVTYIVTLYDTFDFAYDNDYDDLFTTAVNNWAWLCQQTYVLNPITITLSTFA